MFGKKEEETPKFIVMPQKGEYNVYPKAFLTIEEAGKLLFDYPSLYGNVYEIGKKIVLDVHLHVRKEE